MMLTVKCKACDRTAALDGADVVRGDGSVRTFRCRACGGEGIALPPIIAQPPPKPPTPRPLQPKPPRTKPPITAAHSDPTCVRCGEEIPFGRLRAVPGTTLCVDCASS